MFKRFKVRMYTLNTWILKIIIIFINRYNDVRSLILDEYDLNIQVATDVFSYSWEGGKKLANSCEFNDLIISKKLSEAHVVCKEKLNIY